MSSHDEWRRDWLRGWTPSPGWAGIGLPLKLLLPDPPEPLLVNHPGLKRRLESPKSRNPYDAKPDHVLAINIAQKPTRTNVIVELSFQAFQRE
jgi:hypothetical protein